MTEPASPAADASWPARESSDGATERAKYAARTPRSESGAERAPQPMEKTARPSAGDVSCGATASSSAARVAAIVTKTYTSRSPRRSAQ